MDSESYNNENDTLNQYLIDTRAKYEEKISSIENEMVDFCKCAINYEEFDDSEYDGLSLAYSGELEFNDGEDQRFFETLRFMHRMMKEIVTTIDQTIEMGNDKKKKHQSKQTFDSFTSWIRMNKKKSETIIEQEQRLIGEANNAIKVIKHIREESGKN